MSRQCGQALVFVILGLLGSADGAIAADWADGLFGESGHDFGAVARGAKVRHPFVLTNRLAEPITILDVRASCGCTTGRVSTKTVGPGKSAVIEAEMDTRNFVGKKATSLTVSLITAGGKQAEVRLSVISNILSDIVLNPGSIDFGPVSKGQIPSAVLTIDRVGQASWRAERMISTSRALSASLVETARGGDRVSYQLTVSLKPDAPVGTLRDEIRILTNDRESPAIPVLVTGQVRGELTATPSSLSLGNVTSSGPVQGRFVVRATKPFIITSVEGAGDGFSVASNDLAPKLVHIVTIAYQSETGSTRGDLRRTFRLTTDLPGEPPLELVVTAHVNP